MTLLPADDLASIVQRVGPLWERLRGKRLLVTGATGFIGRWMCESARAWAFQRVCAGGSPDFELQPWMGRETGDIREWKPTSGEMRSDYILHLAGPPSCHADQEEMYQVIVRGTERVCAFAKQCGAKLLFASSGAAKDGPGTYAVAKAIAEQSVNEVGSINARIYCVYGAGMNLDRYFIGNCIRDALAGGPIKITGDGRTRRSFLYAQDMAVQLWTLLLSAEPGTYDVGDSRPMSLNAAAHSVAEQFDSGEQYMPVYLSSGQRGEPDSYLPAKPVGGECVDIHEGVRRTIAWLRQ